MKKTVCTLFFCLLPSIATAIQLQAYSIEKHFNAPFPGPPSFTGEIGDQRARGYNYVDENEGLVYSAVYLANKTIFKQSDIASALGYWVKGQALAVGGRVLSQVNSSGYVDYGIQYTLDGNSVTKYARVIYKDGHFYQWSVQETRGFTTASAKRIFAENVPNFKVIE